MNNLHRPGSGELQPLRPPVCEGEDNHTTYSFDAVQSTSPQSPLSADGKLNRRPMMVISEGLLTQTPSDYYETDEDSTDDEGGRSWFPDDGAGLIEKCIAVLAESDAFTDTATGLLTFLMSTVVFVTIGDSMFGGIGIKDQSYIGIAMCVAPASFLGWALTLLSRVPWTVPGVDVTFTPILSEMGAALRVAMKAPEVTTEETEELVPTFVASTCIMYMLVGATLYAVGHSKISSLTNLIPATVVSGFLAGTGVQLVIKAVRMCTGISAEVTLFSAFDHLDLLVPAVLLSALIWHTTHDTKGEDQAPGGDGGDGGGSALRSFEACAAALRGCWRSALSRLPRAFAVPVLLGGAAAMFHAVRLGCGVGLAEATTAGWLFAWSDAEVAGSKRYFSGVGVWAGEVQWQVMLKTCAPYFLTACIIGVLKLAIKAGAFSTIFNKDIDADRELKLLGAMNVVCGLFGCSGIHWSFSNTNLAFELGASDKGGGFVYACCFGVLWLTGIGPLRLIPIFVCECTRRCLACAMTATGSS